MIEEEYISQVIKSKAEKTITNLQYILILTYQNGHIHIPTFLFLEEPSIHDDDHHEND